MTSANPSSQITEMTTLEQRLQALRGNILHRHLGIEFMHDDGQVWLELTVNERNANAGGMLHGGSFYALLDVACYVVFARDAAEGEDATTHDFHASIVRPAPLGTHVRFEGEVIRKANRVIFLRSKAMDSSGQILATATCTKTILKTQ